MARPLRLEYAGAVYHVMSRGHERAALFRDDQDRATFLELLGGVVRDHGWLLHAYCLMGNHDHLLLETASPNLTAGMRRLNGVYTQKFNARHRRAGHLFEGRYKSILVQKESHLLELARYVVLNPVRAGLVKEPGSWRWSSYRATAGTAEPPTWLEVDWTISRFGRHRGEAQHAYRKFVLDGRGLPSPLREVRQQIYLGDDAFLRKTSRRIRDRRSDLEIPVAQRRPWSAGLADVRRAVAKSFEVSAEGLSRSRGAEDKVAAIYLARKVTGLTGADIGKAFNVGAARVSNVIRDVEEGAYRYLLPRLERIRDRLLSVK